METRLILNGGEFHGYVSALQVGVKHTPEYAGRNSTGLLDLRTATDFDLDAQQIWIGSSSGAVNSAFGDVYLPAGQARADQVVVSSVPGEGTGDGMLELNGTVLSVSTSLYVGTNGQLVVNVDTTSSGPELDADASLDVAAGGEITLSFNAEPQNVFSGHYGLRWGGDKVATLETLVSDGDITWNDADPVGQRVGVYFYHGDTFIGIAPPRGSIIMLR
jgi:hypothetical protein